MAEQVRRDYEAHLTAYLITRSTRRWSLIVAVALVACVVLPMLTHHSSHG